MRNPFFRNRMPHAFYDIPTDVFNRKPRRARVRLAELISDQATVDEAIVNKYRVATTYQAPSVVQIGRYKFITQGNHRLTAALLNGKKTAIVSMYEC